MRNKKRISKVLAKLEEVWNKYPDLRLGQMLINIIATDNLYYVTDEQLTSRIRSVIKNGFWTATDPL